jgi:hypothetical protein
MIDWRNLLSISKCERTFSLENVLGCFGIWLYFKTNSSYRRDVNLNGDCVLLGNGTVYPSDLYYHLDESDVSTPSCENWTSEFLQIVSTLSNARKYRKAYIIPKLLNDFPFLLIWERLLWYFFSVAVSECTYSGRQRNMVFQLTN